MKNLKQKNKLIMVVLLIILFAIILTLTGCGKSSNFSVDEILQYMSDKYGEDFTYIEPIDINQPTASSLSIFVESKNYPNKKIFAKCISSVKSDKKRFCDNFISYIYEDATRDLLTNISTTVYPDAKIRYVVDSTVASSYSDDGKLTFEKYLSRERSSISYTIVLPPEHDSTIYKEELANLCKLFKENKVVCSVTIVYLKDDSQFETFITDGKYDDYNGYKLRGDIRVDQNFDIAFEEWR